MKQIEQASSVFVKVESGNPFSLSLQGRSRMERLEIVEPSDYGAAVPQAAQNLLQTIMLAHLVAPYVPEIIETNFPIEHTQFIDRLYDHYGLKPPQICKSSTEPVRTKLGFNWVREHPTIQVATAHSGGLDSAFRLAQRLYCDESIRAVHIRNLNAKGNAREASASKRQCEEWEVPYQEVRLKNSSSNTGFKTMMTRDMLLALIVAVDSSRYGVREVLIEGDMQIDQETSHFSEFSGAWIFFNELLRDVGLELQVKGEDPGDIETIGEILKLEQTLNMQILPLVQNCFSSPFQVPNNRRKWERMAPVLSHASPEQWCGSCYKCRRMTLGRLFYKDPRLLVVGTEERKFFVADTLMWLKKYRHNADLVSESFMTHLQRLTSR